MIEIIQPQLPESSSAEVIARIIGILGSNIEQSRIEACEAEVEDL